MIDVHLLEERYYRILSRSDFKPRSLKSHPHWRRSRMSPSTFYSASA